jgi:hypothetical protein
MLVFPDCGLALERFCSLMMKIFLTRLDSESCYILLPQGTNEVQGGWVGLELRAVMYRTDFDDDKKKLHVKLVVKTCFRQRSLLLAGELADCWCLCSNHRT